MSVDSERKMLAAGNWRTDEKKTLSQCYFRLTKIHTVYPGIKPGSPHWVTSNVRWIHGNPESFYPMFVLTFGKRIIANCWMPRSNFVIICYQLCCCLWATFLHLRAVKVVFMFFFSLLLDIPYGCFHEGSQTRIHYAFLISSRPVTCPAVYDSFPLLTYRTWNLQVQISVWRLAILVFMSTYRHTTDGEQPEVVHMRSSFFCDVTRNRKVAV